MDLTSLLCPGDLWLDGRETPHSSGQSPGTGGPREEDGLSRSLLLQQVGSRCSGGEEPLSAHRPMAPGGRALCAPPPWTHRGHGPRSSARRLCSSRLRVPDSEGPISSSVHWGEDRGGQHRPVRPTQQNRCGTHRQAAGKCFPGPARARLGAAAGHVTRPRDLGQGVWVVRAPGIWGGSSPSHVPLPLNSRSLTCGRPTAAAGDLTPGQQRGLEGPDLPGAGVPVLGVVSRAPTAT